MDDAILWSREPGGPARQIGKIVGGVYVYDNPVIFLRIRAFGISLTVLTHMLKTGAKSISCIVGGDTYYLALSDVWRKAFTDTGGRAGYLYVHLKDWNRQPGRREYPWLPASKRLDLKWLLDAPLVNMRRVEAAEAARPAAVQIGFATMGA